MSTVDIGPEMIPCPAPGMYPRVPSREYFSWDAPSKSRLILMADKSPAHLQYVIEHGQEERDCLRIGDAGHAIMLETARFQEQYICTTVCAGVIKTGSPCVNGGKYRMGGEWFCGVHARPELADDLGEVAIITPSELTRLKSMRKSIADHPIASEILLSPGYTEASFVWNDVDTGEVMKCRTDRFVMWRGKKVVPDIKTTRDASPKGFPREIVKHGYDIQGAVYTDGVSMVTGETITDFILIAVESAPPYAVAVYTIPAPTLARARDRYHELLVQYAECKKTGVWPGYPQEIMEAEMPAWSEQNPLELSFGGETLTM